MSKAIDLAGVVITNNEHGLLLLHRQTKESEQWEMPGGKVKDGETHQETAMREAAEKLGVEVEIVSDSLGRGVFKAHHKTYNYHWFAAQICGDKKPKPNEPCFDDIGYFNIQQLGRLTLSDNMNQFFAVLAEEHIIL